MKVPSEKKELLIDMQGQGRGSVSRLGIFSFYFSNELLLYLLSQREAEMVKYWSPTGYGLQVSLKMIKQVCALATFVFFFRLSNGFLTDVIIYHLHYCHQEASATRREEESDVSKGGL